MNTYKDNRGLWTMIAGFWLLVMFTVGVACANFSWPTLSTSTPNEDMLISETTRFAGLMHVNVRGKITDELLPNQLEAQLNSGETPTAWYNAGVAYYYRPRVKYLSIEVEPGKETCTNIAAHEVCHAKNPFHNLAHWECMAKWATPTYPHP